MMYYESHEVLGTDLPVYKERPIGSLTLEDILNSNQSPENFVKCGFVRVFKYERFLYTPIFKEKGD